MVKIGGASVPPDTLPAHIVIENLEIRSGRPPFTFTNHSGGVETYASNAASMYVEKAEHLVIRNCVLHDSGNGLFIGAYDGATQNILVESNHIYDNGIENSYYQHNTYTAAIHLTYQFNRMGRLRDNCGGNNLKDRSAGLVVRYNWIEDGNRQLDLVDAEDSAVLVDDPDYHIDLRLRQRADRVGRRGQQPDRPLRWRLRDPLGLPQGDPALLRQHRDFRPAPATRP